jgi:hypothetical protein
MDGTASINAQFKEEAKNTDEHLFQLSHLNSILLDFKKVLEEIPNYEEDLPNDLLFRHNNVSYYADIERKVSYCRNTRYQNLIITLPNNYFLYETSYKMMKSQIERHDGMKNWSILDKVNLEYIPDILKFMRDFIKIPPQADYKVEFFYNRMDEKVDLKMMYNNFILVIKFEHRYPDIDYDFDDYWTNCTAPNE